MNEQERIQQKIGALQQRLAKMKKISSDRERKRDLRRKILVGASVLKIASENSKAAAFLREVLARNLKDGDRLMFPEYFE